jgi:eukaryotic-like serine/threonine-protein kinase
MTERSIFFDALDIDDPTERALYLDRACGADPIVRRRVERLLQAHAGAGQFLQPPAGLAGSTAPPAPETVGPPAEAPDSHIDPYKLVRKLGEGGMGTVYLAEQTEPVRRQVALKVIKPGMDSEQVFARFAAERQALALMDHPNIAKVLDAGTTDGGRPYFVMELVPGVPITLFCDTRRLTLRERLELFVPVCRAVQHAHQKGVIHRDLKPSNVLVALYDGRPVPKVIDFGVAKALDQRLTDETLVTGFGQVVGTLEYMAPEQARLNALDIDTRADVYALGVLLYELLTGTTPFDGERLRSVGFDEVLRILREEEPPAPSSRLTTTENLPAVAAQRRAEPARLSRLVRGELDWIVLKALEKDRSRRYDTANSFALDVQRYLADEPVQAGPPSAWYRVRKFGRRNKAALVAAALVAAALVAGTAVATWQAVVATRAKQDAVAAAAAATAAKETAEKREAETTAVLKFVVDKVIAAARPKGQEGGLGRDVKLREAVEAAVPFVDASFTNEPLIEARLRMTLGTSFRFLGEASAAAEQFQTARTLYSKHLGPDHPDTLKSMNSLAVMYDALGRFPEALALRLETFALRRARLGPGHPDTLATMMGLANSYSALGQHDKALRLREETLALVEVHPQLGPGHPDTLLCMNNLANSCEAVGEHDKALRLREETLARRRAHPALGPGHPDTLQSMNNLSVSYNAAGRHRDALKLREEALALRQARLGPDHPDTLNSMHNVAFSYAALGQHGKALQVREETLARRKAHPDLGPDHPDTLRSMHSLALSYTALGRHADALKLHAETLALRKAKLSPNNPETLLSMHHLAAAYQDAGRLPEALPLFEETLALRKAKLSPGHPDTLTSLNSLAEAYLIAQRWADAESVLRECLTICDQKRPDDWQRFHAQSLLGAALLAQQKYVDAEPLLVQGYDGMKQRADKIPVNAKGCLPEALERLVRLYDATGRPQETAKWRKELKAAKGSAKLPVTP